MKSDYNDLLETLHESNECLKRTLDSLEQQEIYYKAIQKRAEAHIKRQQALIEELERQLAELRKPKTPAKVMTLRVVKGQQ